MIEKHYMDEWHFLEVSAKIRDIKKEIREVLKNADKVNVVPAAVQ